MLYKSLPRLMFFSFPCEIEIGRETERAEVPRMMGKSRSMPEYSSSWSGRFRGYEIADDRRGTRQENSYSFNGPRGKHEGFANGGGGGGDPESRRKRRVAAYNLFTVEGRLKSSVRSSVKWIKNKFSDLRYGT